MVRSEQEREAEKRFTDLAVQDGRVGRRQRILPFAALQRKGGDAECRDAVVRETAVGGAAGRLGEAVAGQSGKALGRRACAGRAFAAWKRWMKLRRAKRSSSAAMA